MIKVDTIKPLQVYQLFTGRLHSASVINHPQAVFKQMLTWDYSVLKDNGFNCVYLLGVFDNRGPIIVTEENGEDLTHTPNRLPSVFALSDHTKPNPDLGSLAELKKLIKHIQSFGLKVLLDFVPNHTSTEHPWVTEHPDYYVRVGDDFVREFSGDVFKLNYENPSLRSEMISVLDAIAQLGADGVRCDMAHLVPVDFWHEAIKHVKKSHSRFKFMAEAYTESVFNLEPLISLIDAGFEYIYHEPLYRNFKLVWTEGKPVSHIVDHLNFALKDFPITKLVHYVSNHDDSFIAEALYAREALLALVLFLPGSVLIANGSLHDRLKRLAHHYYDELTDNQTEILNSTVPFSRLYALREDINETLEELKLSEEGLVTARLGNDKLLVLNFSTRTLSLPPHTKALVHNQSNAGLIQSGLAEILEV